MEAGGDNIVRYVYRGRRGEVIPEDATHVTANVRIILADAFRMHPNIVELICHEVVKEIERYAFGWCKSLKRVVMPGVRVVEYGAFTGCCTLTNVDCGKLEIIKACAFDCCESLRFINLPSAVAVECNAFQHCEDLVEAKFGNKLQRFGEGAFYHCQSLERITIPMKDGLFSHRSIFCFCENLDHVDLLDGELHETIAALLREEWKNDMNEKIGSINQILPDTFSGEEEGLFREDGIDPGEKAEVIGEWIRSVLRKIMHFQAKHRRVLDEAALQLALPRDIVTKNVLPFLDLPSYAFEVEEIEEEPDTDLGDEADHWVMKSRIFYAILRDNTTTDKDRK